MGSHARYALEERASTDGLRACRAPLPSLPFYCQTTVLSACSYSTDVAAPVQSAIESVIKKHSHKVAVIKQHGSKTKTTITLTPTPTVVPTVIADAQGVDKTIYVTQTITALPPGATILSNEVSLAQGK